MQKSTFIRALLPLICYLSLLSPLRADDSGACLEPGQWVVPTPQGVAQSTPGEVLTAARAASVVLLGEAHDNADHHLWQLQALAMLLGQRGDLAIGMEMFQTPFQQVLDDYLADKIDERAFLEKSEYFTRWRPQMRAAGGALSAAVIAGARIAQQVDPRREFEKEQGFV